MTKLGAVEHDILDWFITRVAASKAAPEDAKRTLLPHPSSAGLKVRNRDCWLGDLDLSGLSTKVVGHERKGATLIAPDIVVFSANFPIPNGSTILFRGEGNQVYDSWLVESAQLNYLPGLKDDIVVGKLATPLPDAIRPFRLLPADFNKYLNLPGLPVLVTDYERKALIANIRHVAEYFVYLEKPEERLLDYFEELQPGDSGHPTFVVLGGEPVLLTTHTYGGAGSGPFYSHHLEEIEQSIWKIGSDYRDVEIFDVSKLVSRQDLVFQVVVPATHEEAQKREVQILYGDVEKVFEVPAGELRIEYRLPLGTLVRIQLREVNAGGESSIPRVLVDRISANPAKVSEDFYLEPVEVIDRRNRG